MCDGLPEQQPVEGDVAGLLPPVTVHGQAGLLEDVVPNTEAFPLEGKSCEEGQTVPGASKDQFSQEEAGEQEANLDRLLEMCT